MSQVGRTETRLGLLESARNSILLATVLYLMNYSSLSMFPDASPFSRLLLGHPELHRSHTESRVSLHAFPVICCWVEWMNAEKAAWNSFTVCNGFWFMMSWRATSGNYTCISPHSAGNSSSLALRAPVTAVSLSLAIAGINFVLTRVKSIWKTIDQHQPLSTYRWIVWSHLQSTVTTSLL